MTTSEGTTGETYADFKEELKERDPLTVVIRSSERGGVNTSTRVGPEEN